MEKVVSLVDGEVPALFLDWTEAGEIKVPSCRVWRQEFRQELDHLRAVVAHDRVDSFYRSRIT